MSNRSSQNPDNDLPDWLKELRKRQNQPSPSGESSPTSKEGKFEQDPDWLREIGEHKDSEEPEEPEESVRPLSDTQPVPAGDRLKKRRLEQEPQNGEGNTVSSTGYEETLPHAPTFKGEDKEKISPGELPAWLRVLRPSDRGREEGNIIGPPSGEEETVGPLAGLSGVLPAEPSVVNIGKTPPLTAMLNITESQRKHAATFEKLIAAESQPTVDHEVSALLQPRVLNLAMAAILFVATLFPIITRSQAAVRPELYALPEAASVFTLIEELPTGAPVLVAMEVEPALFGESRPAITSVLGHLLERQAQLVFISTRPAGPALAERLISEDFAEHRLIEGEDYVSLGYLSGGMAAVRNFSSDPRSVTISSFAALGNPWESSILETVEQLNDFSLIIVAGSNADDIRSWIEQTTGQLNEGLLAITSAQAAPLLKPFLQSNPIALSGLVSGVSGSAYYERLRGLDGLGRDYWDATSYGVGAIIILILFGGLYIHLVESRGSKASTS